MIRMLGFLLGSALVAALLAAWLSWSARPDLAALVPASLERLQDAANSLPSRPVELPAELPAVSAPEAGRVIPDLPAGPETSASPAPPGDTSAKTPDVEPDGPSPAPEPVPGLDAGAPDPVAEPATGDAAVAAVVWRPFRSERAARGFASHLAERYGASASVRRDGPGLYRVTVSAADTPSLDAELERLRAETGISGLEAGP